MAATRAAYVDYITQLLTLAKQPDPAGAATRILALETADRHAAVGPRAQPRSQRDVQQDDASPSWRR